MYDKPFEAAKRALQGEPAHTPCRRGLAAIASIAAGALFAAGVLTLGVTPSAARASPVGHAQRHAEAMLAFHEGRYAAAYGRLVQLADEGDAPAATLALAMALHGPSLFGSEWSATPGQLRRWSTLCTHDLRERSDALADRGRSD
jgi:hypothetical protein